MISFNRILIRYFGLDDIRIELWDKENHNLWHRHRIEPFETFYLKPTIINKKKEIEQNYLFSVILNSFCTIKPLVETNEC